MVNQIEVKSVLNKQKKRDDWFLCDYSLNPYSGCSFNCIYCYTRGSKYGEHLAMAVSAKSNAPALLDKQLRRRAVKKEYGLIAVGSATDPYMPVEKDLKLTKRLLEIILMYCFPASIGTKSDLVLRDIALLKEIEKKAIIPSDLKPKLKRGAIISFSLSTTDDKLAKIFEPGAPAPSKRLAALRACKDEGMFVGVNFMPLLPFLSDSDEQVDSMIKDAAEHGADFVFVSGLTLFGKGPSDCKTLYYDALERHFPDLVPKCRSLFRIFFAPPWSYQERLDEISRKACKKYGIRYRLA